MMMSEVAVLEAGMEQNGVKSMVKRKKRKKSKKSKSGGLTHDDDGMI